VWGLERGYCLTIGGDKQVVERLDPVFRALAVTSPFNDLPSPAYFRTELLGQQSPQWSLADFAAAWLAADHPSGRVSGSPAKAADIQSLVAAVGMVVKSGTSST